MSAFFLVLLLSVCATTASATLSGPVFQDLAILPSFGGLSPQLAVQSLSVDNSASLFTFSFSLANPSLYLSGGLSINFTLNSGTVVPLTQNFSYPFVVDSTLSTFVVTIGLFETPCTTAPNCNTTYVINAARSAFPVTSSNTYDTTIIIAAVLGGTALFVAVLTLFVFLKSKKMVRSMEEVALTSSDA
jgi:hypothetical protein